MRYYRDPRDKDFRRKVRRRDKSSCQYPGCKVRKKIQVHHIRPYASYPSLKFIVGNGICLCSSCHRKIKGKEELYISMFLTILEQKNGKQI